MGLPRILPAPEEPRDDPDTEARKVRLRAQLAVRGIGIREDLLPWLTARELSQIGNIVTNATDRFVAATPPEVRNRRQDHQVTGDG